MEYKRLIVHGAGGHGRVVADTAKILGYTVIVTDDRDSSRPTLNQACIIAVGDGDVRREFAGNELVTLIHPTAFISETVKIGAGTYVGPQAVVNVNSELGRGVIINTGAVVEHDCKIGDWTHISPGAVLCGTVTIGEGCWIGANSVIKEGVRISPNVIVGCGAVVIRDITKPGTHVGTPVHQLPVLDGTVVACRQ